MPEAGLEIRKLGLAVARRPRTANHLLLCRTWQCPFLDMAASSEAARQLPRQVESSHETHMEAHVPVAGDGRQYAACLGGTYVPLYRNEG